MGIPQIILSKKYVAAGFVSLVAFLPVMFDLIKHAPIDQIQTDTTNFVSATKVAFLGAIAGNAIEDAANHLSGGTPGKPELGKVTKKPDVSITTGGDASLTQVDEKLDASGADAVAVDKPASPDAGEKKDPPDASPPAVPAVKPKPPAPPTGGFIANVDPTSGTWAGGTHTVFTTSNLPSAVTKVLGPSGELPPALGTTTSGTTATVKDFLTVPTTSGTVPASTARSGAASAYHPTKPVPKVLT